MPDTTSTERYSLSFTSGGLLVREAVLMVPIFLEERNWNRVREIVAEGNLFQTRTQSSGQRLAREVAQRLAVLTDGELAIIVDGTWSERNQFMWLAACRRYAFIGEFAEEVLRERYLLFTPELSGQEFDTFLRGKAIWHPELDELKDSTIRKLRTELFRMLTEAEFLSERGEIVPVVVSERAVDLLNMRKPSDLRFFPSRQGGTDGPR